MNIAQYYIKAAEESQWSFKLWIRYLNKHISRASTLITADDVKVITESGKLQEWQKAILELAMDKTTIIWQIVVEYSEPAKDNWRYQEAVSRWQHA